MASAPVADQQAPGRSPRGPPRVWSTLWQPPSTTPLPTGSSSARRAEGAVAYAGGVGREGGDGLGHLAVARLGAPGRAVGQVLARRGPRDHGRRGDEGDVIRGLGDP